MFCVADCQIETFGNSSNQMDSVCQQNSIGSTDIPNGVGCFDGIISGSAILYQCDEGYTIVGSINQICLSDGDWSGQTPTCQLIGKF